MLIKYFAILANLASVCWIFSVLILLLFYFPGLHSTPNNITIKLGFIAPLHSGLGATSTLGTELVSVGKCYQKLEFFVKLGKKLLQQLFNLFSFVLTFILQETAFRIAVEIINAKARGRVRLSTDFKSKNKL